MCSDESHFNVSLIVRDKVTRPCPQTTASEERESRSGIKPRSRFRGLGQTGSRMEELGKKEIIYLLLL